MIRLKKILSYGILQIERYGILHRCKWVSRQAALRGTYRTTFLVEISPRKFDNGREIQKTSAKFFKKWRVSTEKSKIFAFYPLLVRSDHKLAGFTYLKLQPRLVAVIETILL